MKTDLPALLVVPLVSFLFCWAAFLPGCVSTRAATGDGLEDLAAIHARTREVIGSTAESLKQVVAHDVSRPHFEEFSHELDELHALSTEAGAALADLRTAGEDYFSLWIREIAQMREVDDRRRAEQNERDRMAEFDRVGQQSEDANMVVRDYVHRLDEMRTSLGRNPSASSLERLRGGATDLADKARDVQRKLDEALETIRKTRSYFGGSGDTR